MSLLTDFGARDPSAGICRAVVLGIAPDALVVDITHDVRKFAVRDGALLLWCAVPYLPIGAHVAVVDPGVGTDRRGIAIETSRGDYLVGPDNGLLVPAASRLGGIVRVHTLENPQYRLPVITSSFHGRDIFSPGAAHLAMGVPLEFVGPAVDPRTLVLLDWPEPQVYDGLLRTSILYLDTFGNVKLSALGGHMLNAFGGLREGEWLYLRIEDDTYSRDLRVPWVGTFGRVPVGQVLVYEDFVRPALPGGQPGIRGSHAGPSRGHERHDHAPAAPRLHRRARGRGRPCRCGPAESVETRYARRSRTGARTGARAGAGPRARADLRELEPKPDADPNSRTGCRRPRLGPPSARRGRVAGG